MGVSGVCGSDQLSNQAIQQEQGSQPAAGRQQGHWRRDGHHLNSGDRFSPSSSQGQAQSEQNTGTYSVNQVDLFSVAAQLVLVQGSSTSTSLENQSAASPSDGSSSPAPASTPASAPASTGETNTPAVNGGPSTSSSPTASVQQPAGDLVAANAAVATNSSSSTAAGSQDPLQALNNALTSLGLNQQQIQAFDQVASLIETLSPTAFSDLVSQFQQLAQQMTQTATAAPSAQSVAAGTTTSSVSTPSTSSADGNTSTNSTTPSNSNPSGGNVQIEELTIRFSGTETQGSTGNTANGSAGSQGANNGGSFQVSAFKLKIEEVNITLTGDNGQVAQVQTPSQPENADSSGGTQPAGAPNTAAA